MSVSVNAGLAEVSLAETLTQIHSQWIKRQSSTTTNLNLRKGFISLELSGHTWTLREVKAGAQRQKLKQKA